MGRREQRVRVESSSLSPHSSRWSSNLNPRRAASSIIGGLAPRVTRASPTGRTGKATATAAAAAAADFCWYPGDYHAFLWGVIRVVVEPSSLRRIPSNNPRINRDGEVLGDGSGLGPKSAAEDEGEGWGEREGEAIRQKEPVEGNNNGRDYD